MSKKSDLTQCLEYLKRVIQYRLHHYLKGEKLPFPSIEKLKETSPLSVFVNENRLSQIELVALLVALVPNLSPSFLNDIIHEYLPEGGEFVAFGGVKGKNHRGILPTGETLQFILAGDDLELRNQIRLLFDSNHFFTKYGILQLSNVSQNEPKMSGILQLDDEYVQLFTTGFVSDPSFGIDFPAAKIETQLEWDDLVLPEKTFQQIREIETWLLHHHTLMEQWGMKDRIKPGFRVMFYGPPGTGKTLTASLLGKYTGKKVFRIDLSMVVSKYIGETEKNLSKLFDKAKNKDWILFFDEADAIFGKRTSVRDAHDKYANQEVSYLLQRIESHSGLVLLASNLKSNIDSAFTRRFQSIIKFDNPGAAERLQLWEKNFPKPAEMAKDVSLSSLAKQYQLTGANIVNVIQYASLRALSNGGQQIKQSYLIAGIKREYEKDGKML